jgi:hypothetical protein
MTRKYHSTVIDEYLFLKNKVAKLVAKSKKNDKAILTNRATLIKARKFIRRMLEIEGECKQNGWPHPETFAPSYVDKDPSEFRMSVDSKMLTNPDGTLLSSKPEPLPLVDKSSIRGQTTNFITYDEVAAIPDKVMNPDGSLFETPKLEGSFLKRRSETD